MNDIQAKLFEMFTWLTNYLNKNKIRYFVVGGTMLGAARHHGFIPWDDDIDIAVPRADYDRLIASFDKQIDNYILESPKNDDKDYLYTYAKMYDVRTTLVEHLKKDVVRGTYIDIFPLDGIGNTADEAMKNFKKIDRLNVLLTMRVSRVRKGRKWWKNIATIIGNFIPINCKKTAKKLDLICSKHDFDECRYVGILAGTYRSKEIMDKTVYGIPTVYDFEGLKVTGPEKCDEYLKKLYGDWRHLPPKDKQVSAHDFVYIDLTSPWSNYKVK